MHRNVCETFTDNYSGIFHRQEFSWHQNGWKKCWKQPQRQVEMWPNGNVTKTHDSALYVEVISNSLSSSSKSSRRSLMRKVRSALAEGGGELSEDAASGPGDWDRELPDATAAACGAAHGSCSLAPCVTSSLKQSSRLMIPPNVYGWNTRKRLFIY